MSDDLTGHPTRRLVYAWEGEVAGLHARIKELEGEVLEVAAAARRDASNHLEAYRKLFDRAEKAEAERDAIEAATIERCVDAIYTSGLLTGADAMHAEGAIRLLALKPPVEASNG